MDTVEKAKPCKNIESDLNFEKRLISHNNQLGMCLYDENPLIDHDKLKRLFDLRKK